MRRRTFLCLLGLSATAGCTGRTSLRASGREPATPVAEREISVYERGSDFYARAPDPSAPPTVEYRPDENRVTVEGTLFVGPRTCADAALGPMTYESETGTLWLSVVSGETDSDDRCPVGESADAYRVDLAFDGELPRTVVVLEQGTQQTRRTAVDNPN